MIKIGLYSPFAQNPELKRPLLSIFFLLTSLTSIAQAPKVLIVTAYPDDESRFLVVVFKITHEMNGSADLVLLTDASGGFNGMVASSYFGMDMLDSAVGRKLNGDDRLGEVKKLFEALRAVGFPTK